MAECKQDMPPVGGYNPIVYEKVPMKPTLSKLTKFGIFLGISAFGFWGFFRRRKQLIDESIEMRCGTIALYPMVAAEVDRMMLKQLKRNRDAEERIMKDVEGWEVGTYKGMPVFATLDADTYCRVHFREFYAHTENMHKWKSEFVHDLY